MTAVIIIIIIIMTIALFSESMVKVCCPPGCELPEGRDLVLSLASGTKKEEPAAPTLREPAGHSQLMHAHAPAGHGQAHTMPAPDKVTPRLWGNETKPGHLTILSELRRKQKTHPPMASTLSLLECVTATHLSITVSSALSCPQCR